MKQELSKKERREDHALAKKLKAGNHRAWTRFYELYAAPLFRFTLQRVNGQEDVAADIAQDSIVVAMERIATYKPRKGSLWAWLCGITVNKTHESLRTQKRDHELQERIKRQPNTETPQPHLEPYKAEHIHDALHTLAPLNPRHQQVLSLKYVEGYKVRDIADQLGLSEKAVESRLTRAREAFRKAHEDQKEKVMAGANTK